VTVIDAEALLPPASQAVMVIEFVPEASGTETLQDAEPGTVPCWFVCMLNQEMTATPTLSEAVPVIVIGLVDVEAVGGAGLTIVIVGGVVSLDDPTMSVTLFVVFPLPFVVFVKVTVSV
jgi:hypothetical protein